MFQLPSGNPSTRGVEYFAGDAKTPPQIVFGIERRQALFARREDRRAERGVRRQGHRRPQHAGDPAGPARQRRPQLAADHVQEPDHHRRAHAGEPAAGARRATCARGTSTPASWSGRSTRCRGAGEKFNDTWAGDSWKNRSGVNVWGLITVDAAARHRLHAVRRAVDRSLRRRSRRRQPLQLQPRRGRRQHRQISLALPGRASRHLGRRRGQRRRC